MSTRREKWSYDEVIGRAMRGIDVKKANDGDDKEQKKFRRNVERIMKDMISLKPNQKSKAIQALKAGSFGLMTQLPIITPVITAMLQTVTSDDLGEKMDDLGEKMDGLGEKMDGLGGKMDGLGNKMDGLGGKMDSGFRLIARLIVEENEKTRREILAALG